MVPTIWWYLVNQTTVRNLELCELPSWWRSLRSVTLQLLPPEGRIRGRDRKQTAAWYFDFSG